MDKTLRNLRLMRDFWAKLSQNKTRGSDFVVVTEDGNLVLGHNMTVIAPARLDARTFAAAHEAEEIAALLNNNSTHAEEGHRFRVETHFQMCVDQEMRMAQAIEAADDAAAFLNPKKDAA